MGGASRSGWLPAAVLVVAVAALVWRLLDVAALEARCAERGGVVIPNTSGCVKVIPIQ